MANCYYCCAHIGRDEPYDVEVYCDDYCRDAAHFKQNQDELELAQD